MSGQSHPNAPHGALPEGGRIMAANLSTYITLDPADAAHLWSVFSEVAEWAADDVKCNMPASTPLAELDRTKMIYTVDRPAERLAVALSICSQVPYDRLAGDTNFAGAAAIAADRMHDNMRCAQEAADREAHDYIADAAHAQRSFEILSELALRGGAPRSLEIPTELVASFERTFDWIWYGLVDEATGSWDEEKSPEFALDLAVLNRAMLVLKDRQMPAKFEDRYRLHDIAQRRADQLHKEIAAYYNGEALEDQHKADLELLTGDLEHAEAVLRALGGTGKRVKLDLAVVEPAATTSERVAA